jgi:hypothetical protein
MAGQDRVRRHQRDVGSQSHISTPHELHMRSAMHAYVICLIVSGKNVSGQLCWAHTVLRSHTPPVLQDACAGSRGCTECDETAKPGWRTSHVASHADGPLWEAWSKARRQRLHHACTAQHSTTEHSITRSAQCHQQAPASGGLCRCRAASKDSQNNRKLLAHCSTACKDCEEKRLEENTVRGR